MQDWIFVIVVALLLGLFLSFVDVLVAKYGTLSRGIFTALLVAQISGIILGFMLLNRVMVANIIFEFHSLHIVVYSLSLVMLWCGMIGFYTEKYSIFPVFLIWVLGIVIPYLLMIKLYGQRYENPIIVDWANERLFDTILCICLSPISLGYFPQVSKAVRDLLVSRSEG